MKQVVKLLSVILLVNLVLVFILPAEEAPIRINKVVVLPWALNVSLKVGGGIKLAALIGTELVKSDLFEFMDIGIMMEKTAQQDPEVENVGGGRDAWNDPAVGEGGELCAKRIEFCMRVRHGVEVRPQIVRLADTYRHFRRGMS